MLKSKTLFDGARMTQAEAISRTSDSLNAYGRSHRRWVIAWSGGKDSTATLTVVLYLIEAGFVAPPETLTVCYADTRMEIPPLAASAAEIVAKLRSLGVDVRVVVAPLDERFFVYMLGRGVPPPNNNTLRWCTSQIKVEPMQAEIARIVGESGGDVLFLTGVRLGESAARDDRIAVSCGRDGAECGQGWYQRMTGDGFATLAPLLHWRVCHVWDWLNFNAPRAKYGGWPTELLAAAYGGNEAEEINARTGCIECPLASKDTAMDYAIGRWPYLAPLKELKTLYRSLREPQYRLRMPGGERRKDGTLSKNQNRMGPLTLEARRWGLAVVLDVQRRCNERRGSMPAIDILNDEERRRIEELIAAGTWPNKWTGDEPRADEPFDAWDAAGNVQQSLLRD